MGVDVRLAERWEQAFRDHGAVIAYVSAFFLGVLFALAAVAVREATR